MELEHLVAAICMLEWVNKLLEEKESRRNATCVEVHRGKEGQLEGVQRPKQFSAMTLSRRHRTRAGI